MPRPFSLKKTPGHLLAVIVLGVLFSWVAPAIVLGESADPAQKLFELAMETENRGDTQKALEFYEQVFKEHPQSFYAGEALFRTAYIHDERLLDPPEAIQRYRQYLKSHAGRNAPRAEKRIQVLEKFAKGDVEQYQAFTKALNSYSREDRARPERMMDRFIRDYPDCPFLDEALLFSANEKKGFKRTIESPEHRERVIRAMELYQRLIRDFPGTRNALNAWKNLGDCHRMLGDFKAARKCYNTVLDQGGEYGKKIVGQYMLMARLDSYRNQVFYAVLPLTFLFFGLLFWTIPFNATNVKNGLKKGLVGSLFFLPFAVGLVAVTWYFTDPAMNNNTGMEPWLVAILMVLTLLGLLTNGVAMAADEANKIPAIRYFFILMALLACLGFCAFYFLDLLPYLETLFL